MRAAIFNGPETFFRNVGWRGGPAPARIYIPELLGDVLDETIDPGRVFDYETGLDHIGDAYKAMDERRDQVTGQDRSTVMTAANEMTASTRYSATAASTSGPGSWCSSRPSSAARR